MGTGTRPVIAVYTAVVYWLFHGKLRKGIRLSGGRHG